MRCPRRREHGDRKRLPERRPNRCLNSSGSEGARQAFGARIARLHPRFWVLIRGSPLSLPTFRTGSRGVPSGTSPRSCDGAPICATDGPVVHPRAQRVLRTASLARHAAAKIHSYRTTHSRPHDASATARDALSLSLHASHSTRARPAKFWRATLADVTNGRRRSVHAATCRAQLSSLLVLLASVRAPPQREPPSPAHTLVYTLDSPLRERGIKRTRPTGAHPGPKR